MFFARHTHNSSYPVSPHGHAVSKWGQVSRNLILYYGNTFSLLNAVSENHQDGNVQNKIQNC